MYSDGSYATINIPSSVNNFVEGINLLLYRFQYLLLYYNAASCRDAANCRRHTRTGDLGALLLLGFTGLGSAGYRNARNGRTALSA
jgi:hypothetical protein